MNKLRKQLHKCQSDSIAIIAKLRSLFNAFERAGRPKEQKKAAYMVIREKVCNLKIKYKLFPKSFPD